jgi:hypothetical protein
LFLGEKMRKLTAAFLLCFISLAALANEPPGNQLVAAPAPSSDTLAKRHPLLALATLATMKHVFGTHVSGGPLADDMVIYSDFAMALVAPSALESNDFLAGALVMGASGTLLKGNQLMNGVVFSGALSQFNNGIRKYALPYLGNTTSHLVAAAADFAPAAYYYRRYGVNKKTFAGMGAKASAEKSTYVILDAVEQGTIDTLQAMAGGESGWIKPVAQLGNSVLLIVTGASTHLLSGRILQIAARLQLPGINNEDVLAFLTTCMFEIGGYRAGSVPFSAVDGVTTNYNAYINPAIALGTLTMATTPQARIWVAGQHKYVRATFLNATLASMIQVIVSIFSLPGWLEDIPSNLYNGITNRIWGATAQASPAKYTKARDEL